MFPVLTCCEIRQQQSTIGRILLQSIETYRALSALAREVERILAGTVCVAVDLDAVVPRARLRQNVTGYIVHATAYDVP